MAQSNFRDEHERIQHHKLHMEFLLIFHYELHLILQCEQSIFQGFFLSIAELSHIVLFCENCPAAI